MHNDFHLKSEFQWNKSLWRLATAREKQRGKFNHIVCMDDKPVSKRRREKTENHLLNFMTSTRVALMLTEATCSKHLLNVFMLCYAMNVIKKTGNDLKIAERIQKQKRRYLQIPFDAAWKQFHLSWHNQVLFRIVFVCVSKDSIASMWSHL